MRFNRPEHQAVAAVLQAMDHDFLMNCGCWFGGGTEIVLDLGEYRLSKDIDFLCSDTNGYRTIRSAVTRQGAAGLFNSTVQQPRAFRTDQYGVRGIVSVNNIHLRFEVVREARIDLSGGPDYTLGVPRLSQTDRIAEKMLANADRCQDRSTGCRDAVDLGMLALRHGAFPEAALLKAEAAYGDDVMGKMRWVLDHLLDPEQRRHAAGILDMDPVLLDSAGHALRSEICRLRPAAFPSALGPITR